ncbi:hypothetical protein LSH36_535g03006 [Paralvinella palmiformis]|uniref:Chitin-binding type-2 domain-containing protein n=1 Tax=Paralvinella palmiformis TaxID=53620 RepID=A0AAD9J884_9ANNE|nr:hypothetical protein LSH36_535g03006 [Paralvinella palmiformis]
MEKSVRHKMEFIVLLAIVISSGETLEENGNVLQDENDLIQYNQFCYSCSSDTPMCDETVYDSQYLTSVPCKSSCFLRREDNVTYRGCFDGWIGGMVRNNYVGCQTQIYFGKAVEWCFCNSVGTDQGQPCNGQSRDVIAQNAATYGRRKSYADYGSAVAKSGYDNYQEEYPFINKEADKYEQSQGELYTCKDKKDGTYNDPNDCNRYYLCSNGYAYRMRCPRGTQWNQVLRACAFSFHPMYPCKLTSYGDEVTSYPYGTQRPTEHQGAQLRQEPEKKTKDMEEFYHYF